MLKALLASFSLALAAPALGIAAEPTIPWVCITQPTSQDASVHLMIADSDVGRVQDGEIVLTDGRAAKLPDLAYFVGVSPTTMAWGARNTRTGASYYRYQLDQQSGLLSYSTGDGLKPVGKCLHPEG